jgi:uncharacterized phage protein gp47/JayE
LVNFKSFGQILQEQIDYLASVVSPLTDVNVGSATRTLLEAVALVLAEYHYLAQQLMARFWVSSASGQWLDMRASEYGLARVQAGPTLRNLTVSHAAGPAVTIPVGQRFATLPGAAVQVVYQVTQEAILGAGSNSIAVAVVSTTSGAATAIPNGTALRQQGTALAYIDGVVTSTVSIAGTDRESDDALRARVLDRLRNPPGPGSAADYERAVLDAFAGTVASVTVVPLWAGPGTVEVLILGPLNAVPSGGTIADVQAYLDTWAPIGADVTVAAPTTVAIDVNVTVAVGGGFAWGNVHDNVATAIRAYIESLGLGADVLIASEGDAIWRTSGVGGASGNDGGNYATLQQRVSPDAYAATDIAIADTQKAVPGTITVLEGP